MEHRRQPLISRRAFGRRMVRAATFSVAIVAGSVALGVAGYRIAEGMPWIDALLNTCMLLGGMGPVTELHTVGGKLFASFFSLYSGLVFLVAAGVLFFPLYHRFIHKFHLEFEEEKERRHVPKPKPPAPEAP